jgi:hypothetical protein
MRKPHAEGMAKTLTPETTLRDHFNVTPDSGKPAAKEKTLTPRSLPSQPPESQTYGHAEK